MGISVLGIRLFYIDGPLVKRSRRRPLTPQTGVRFSHGSPRRNGLHSIQKAQPNGWAFLIPFRHSSLSPQNFARQTFAGAPLPGENERPGRMDYIPFKKPSRMAGLFSYHFVIPPYPHKTLQGKLLRGPAAGGKRTPRQNRLHSIQKLRQMTGLFSYHFVIPPYPRKTLQGKLLRGPCCRENERPGRMNCILFKELSYFAGLFLFIRPSRAERIKPGL